MVWSILYQMPPLRSINHEYVEAETKEQAIEKLIGIKKVEIKVMSIIEK